MILLDKTCFRVFHEGAVLKAFDVDVLPKKRLVMSAD